MDIVDAEDPSGDEERRIRARQLKMYTTAALKAGIAVANRYVMFPQLRAVLDAFDRVYQLSRELEIPQGIVLDGPPGSSKTSICRYFCDALPPTHDVIDGYGALTIRLRANPSAGCIVSSLLRAIKHPFTTVRVDRLMPMRDIAFDALRHKGTRVLFVDHAHCLAPRSRAKPIAITETSASDILRELMEATGIGVVLLVDSSFKGLELVDGGLADRVSVRMSLRHFEVGSVWSSFLDGFVSAVAVPDLGALRDAEMSVLVHQATGGSRRSTKRLLAEAVMVATDAGTPKLQLDHLRVAFERAEGSSHAIPNPFASRPAAPGDSAAVAAG